MKKLYIYEKYVDFVECSLSWNTCITYEYDVRPSKLWEIAYVAIGQKSLETSGLLCKLL